MTRALAKAETAKAATAAEPEAEGEPEKKEQRTPRKGREEKSYPPEKNGSWVMKEQREGEADNPGPWHEEIDSGGDVISTLTEDEDSDFEFEIQEEGVHEVSKEQTEKINKKGETC